MVEFAPDKVQAAFSYNNPDTAARIAAGYRSMRLVGDPSDAGRAIADITAQYAEPITVLDISKVLILTREPSAWSAIHGAANYAYMPSARRRVFIGETATRLQRTGWLVVDRWVRDHSWIDDFESAYQRVEVREYGTYSAIRYRPLAGSTSGPR